MGLFTCSGSGSESASFVMFAKGLVGGSSRIRFINKKSIDFIYNS